MTGPGSPSRRAEVHDKLVYARHDGVELPGDLYVPEGAGPFPVLVALHGGAWKGGSRTAFRHWGHHFAARGYALFAASYRLAGKQQPGFPHAVRDVLAAVQFVRARSADFRLDPQRVGLLGASAGAHLAALAALAGGTPLFAGHYPQDAHAAVDASVKVLVGVYGIYDLVDQWQRFQAILPRENSVEMFVGAAPMDDRRIYFDASPISYATVANNRISVFLSWGTADDFVDPARQSEAFVLALQQAGFYVRTCPVVGAPHFWMNEPVEELASFSAVFAPRLVRFLAERL